MSSESILLQFIDGKLSRDKCKEQLSEQLLSYTTEIDFIENPDVEIRQRKVRLLHSKLMALVDDIDKIN